MSKPRPWTVVREESVADFRVFCVTALHSERAGDGLAHTFVRVSCGDWVNVVPLTPTGEVVMIRQFRHGLNTPTLEIPGGMVDEGEEPVQAATRRFEGQDRDLLLLLASTSRTCQGLSMRSSLAYRSRSRPASPPMMPRAPTATLTHPQRPNSEERLRRSESLRVTSLGQNPEVQ